MTNVNSSEEGILNAIRSDAFDGAIELWEAYQENTGVCDDKACESQLDKRICCACNMHGYLFTLALTQSDEKLAVLSRKLGTWIGHQEITNAVPPITGKNVLRLPDTLLTGHPTVDYEHRQLINILNHFSAALEDEDYKTAEAQIIFFFDLLIRHFENEEGILREIKFPDVEEHKNFHDQLRSRASKYIEATRNLVNDDTNKEALQIELIAMLFDDAIKADMDIKSFLMDKGFGTPT